MAEEWKRLFAGAPINKILTIEAAQITGVHNVLDDLTKSQRDDGQVVAGQTQNRDADEHAEQTCHRAADHEGQQQCKGLRGVFGHDDIDERTGERADAHEAGVAEAQLTQHTDGQVQRDRHNDIGADGHELAGEGVCQRTGGTQNLNQDIEADNNAQRNDVAFGGLFHIFQHSSHLKPSR